MIVIISTFVSSLLLSLLLLLLLVVVVLPYALLMWIAVLTNASLRIPSGEGSGFHKGDPRRTAEAVAANHVMWQ